MGNFSQHNFGILFHSLIYGRMFDLSARDKPVLKWAGGKASLLPQLIRCFPTEFNRYVEPFLGGGALFFALKSGCRAILGDSNEELFSLYSVVRDDPGALMARLDFLAARYCEAFYYQLRAAKPTQAVDRAARTIFLNKTGFNGLYRQNSRGLFNVPFGKRRFCPQLYDRSNLIRVSTRLKKANLLHADFEAVIRRARKGDFIYCDPPYEPLSLTSSFNSYLASGFSTRNQIRLRDACVQAAERGAIVAVSNSTALLITHLYGDWPMHSILARRAINSSGSGRGRIAELCILLGPPKATPRRNTALSAR